MSERTDDKEYETLQKEYGEQPAPNDPAPAAPAPTSAPAPAPAAAEPGREPLSYEELSRRHDDLRSALRELRLDDGETKQRLRNMEEVFARVLAERKEGGAQAKQPPDPQTDPLGHYDYRLEEQGKQLKELREQNENLSQEQRSKQEFETFLRSAVAEEVDYASKMPDYYQAATHLENNRRQELAVIYPDNDAVYNLARQNGFPTIQAFRESILNQDRIAVAQQARNQGVNAGEYYYRLAQARGYQRQAAPVVPPPGSNGKDGQHATSPRGDGKFERMQKGMQASSTLSSAGGAPNDAPDDDTIEALAQMYLEDPKEADKVFTKLKKQGKLG